MSTLSHREIRNLIESLCRMWDASTRSDYEGRAELDEERAVAIHTTAHHATRMARALLLVDEQLDGIEGVPLARSVLESAITAVWLLLTPDSGHLIVREGAKARKVALEDLIAQGEEAGPGYEQAVVTLDYYQEQGLSGASHLLQRSRAFQGGDQLYSIYRAFSGRSHPGVGIMDFYVVENPASDIGMSFNPDAVDDAREATLGVTAHCLLLALYADELARRKPHRTTQLEKAAKKLGMTLELVRADGTSLPDRRENS